MPQINYLAIVVATVASFGLGALWYSPLLFLNPWLRATGLPKQQGHPPQVFVIAFLLTLASAFAFAWWLGSAPPLSHALTWGLVVGLCFVVTSMGINILFANRPITLWLIDGGFHVARFVAMGLILGLWH